MKQTIKFACTFIALCGFATAVISCTDTPPVNPPTPTPTAHAITLTDDGNGTVIATVDGKEATEALAEKTVTITATPKVGFAFDKWTVEKGNVVPADATLLTMTFTMPDEDVEIKATFKEDETLYTITFAAEITGGTATATMGGATVTEVKAGSEVTVTATPAEGNVFGIWTSPTAGVVFKNAAEGTTTFTMPAANVVISASFIDASLDVFTKIPDANFKSHCAQYDTDKDGILTLTEADAVTQIKVTFRKVASLEGVEYFRNLTHLDCGMQSVSNSPLTSLDLSKNIALVELNCQINSIATLDLSKNINLTTVLAQQNKLTSIILPESDKITKLDVNQNQFTSLDVSKLSNLETLMCSINKLTSLDVSKNAKLQFLFCSDNDLGTIDVTKNPELLELYCSRAGLTTVDVTKNPKLNDLGVIGNRLTTVDLSNNPEVIWLELFNNRITSLDLSKNTKLTDLQVQDNLLTSIDVSKNPELNFFYCYNNEITSLDVSNNPRLNNLKCWNNRMSELDASNMRLDMGVFYVHCGNQTTDGTTPQTLTLTLREDMKAFYTKNLANANEPETNYQYNNNVVLAE